MMLTSDRFIASAMSLVRMRTGGTDQGAGDDQRGAVDDETGHRDRGAGEGVEQRDDDGHVRAADGQRDQDSQGRARPPMRTHSTGTPPCPAV